MKLYNPSYTTIIDIVCSDPTVSELIKALLKETKDVIQDLIHDNFMLECEILDVDDALRGKELDWNSVKSAERCRKILKLLGDKR